MDNLFQNRLFLQYLSGAGAALQAGQPISAGIDPITKQNIAAQSKARLQQSYMKTLQQMLGGLPANATLKGTRDKLTLDIPTTALKDDFDPLARTEAEGGTSSSDIGQLGTLLREGEGGMDPISSLPDIEAADLAGLTAADVSQALSGAVGVQALKQRGIEARVAARQGERRMSDVERRTADMERRTEIAGRPRPVKHEPLDEPFVGGYSLREYKSLTADTKEYVLAKEGAKLPGDEEFMSQREWETLDPTEKEKFVRAAMKDPKLMEAAKELTRTEPSELRRPLVTWTSAYRFLEGLFGKRDPTGMWAVTPELQSTFDKAREFLTENKRKGMEPLEAVNDANKRSRAWMVNIERGFSIYMEKAQGIKDKALRESTINRIITDFRNKYGYMPSGTRR